MFMLGVVTYTYVVAHSEGASIHELPRSGLLGNSVFKEDANT